MRDLDAAVDEEALETVVLPEDLATSVDCWRVVYTDVANFTRRLGALSEENYNNSRSPRITLICEVEVMAGIEPDITFSHHSAGRRSSGAFGAAGYRGITKLRASGAPLGTAVFQIPPRAN